METVFSTANVHARDRLDYWHAAVRRNLADHDFHASRSGAFHGELSCGALADIGLLVFENSALNVTHTARHAANANAGEIFVRRQIAGTMSLEQDGRSVLLRPGEMTLVDPTAPYSAIFSESSKSMVIKIPRRVLNTRVGHTLGMTAINIEQNNILNVFLSDTLSLLPNYACTSDEAAACTIRDQTIDLICLALATIADGDDKRISSSRAIARLRVRAAIEARLADPALDAAEVAAAAGVSVRYANKLLASEDTSIVRLIQATRLARCRKALEDPSQSHRTLGEIAYGWGFSDMTHFGRKFRAAYGLSPREHRKLKAASRARNVTPRSAPLRGSARDG